MLEMLLRVSDGATLRTRLMTAPDALVGGRRISGLFGLIPKPSPMSPQCWRAGSGAPSAGKRKRRYSILIEPRKLLAGECGENV